LTRDFAEYEKLSDYCAITESALEKAMFGPKSFVESLVAFDGSKMIGYAIFYPNFASFRGQLGLYLEDIYVDAAYRGRGVGDEMLRMIARAAKERGFERIDFQVLEWNTPAISFYEKRGVVRSDDERHYKFSDMAFEDLAS
jgi:ribosomal protein S18 acetylase RimI-like enzyme